MNKNNGHIIETKRAKDGSEVQVREKEIDVATLKTQLPQPKIEEAKPVEQPAEQVVEKTQDTPQSIEDEWNDLERQRDIAFKIMYFFLVFIVATFGLLYVFFRMTQEQEQALRKDTVKNQRARVQEQTFQNVSIGKNDEEDIVNPYAFKTPTQVTGQFTSASTPFVNLAATSYAKAQQFTLMPNNTGKEVPSHRVNAGFGANNLSHLGKEEKGRFDDPLNESAQNPNFSLLSNLSTHEM